jgi:DNA polymerase III delta subunit
VNYFARKHDISKEQAQRLIDRVGNNREKLNREAEKLKRR